MAAPMYEKTCKTLLAKYAKAGDISRLHKLLSNQNFIAGVTECLNNKSGDTVVHIATREGQLDLLQFLYDTSLTCVCPPLTDVQSNKEFKINIFEITNCDGKMPLHEASQHCQEKCVWFLLDVPKVQVDPLKRSDW